MTTTQPDQQTAPDVLDVGASAAAELAIWQQGFASKPDEWHEPGKCRYCAAVIPPPYFVESKTGAYRHAITVCEPCVVTKRAEYDAEQARQARANLNRFCPPDFADNWNPTLGNERLRLEAFKAFSVSMRHGLVIHGTSGSCKTRVAWEIIKDIEARPPGEGFSWRFLDGFDLAAKGIPAEAYAVPLLVIDDLGNEPPGTKWETGLLHMLRKRCDYHRITIVTTQLTGAQFAARFFNGASGSAILRRLMQRCTAVKSDTGTITKES